MKKALSTLLAVAGTVTMACAAGVAPSVQTDALPAKARSFIGEYFRQHDITSVKRGQWPTGYEVVFDNGTRAEFNANGRWTQVDCCREAVPSVIVPQRIRSYVNSRYPKETIVSVSRDRRGYDVELSNGFELGFDRKFRLVDFDD